MIGTRAVADSTELGELDQPPYEGPRKYYAICSTPRTGSSLLCDLLIKAGVGAPDEYFHRRKHIPMLLSHFRLLGLRASRVTVHDYIETLKQNRTTPNGYFGFKVHRGQFKWLIDNCDLGQCFPNLKYVYISRRDVVAQAVSESKAVQTKQWNSAQDPVAEPEYDEAHITYCIQTIRKANRYWRRYFEDRGIEPLRMEYEDLVVDMKREFGRVLDFLGADDTLAAPALCAVTLEKQFDSLNRQWIERYRASRGGEDDQAR